MEREGYGQPGTYTSGEALEAQAKCFCEGCLEEIADLVGLEWEPDEKPHPSWVWLGVSFDAWRRRSHNLALGRLYWKIACLVKPYIPFRL